MSQPQLATFRTAAKEAAPAYAPLFHVLAHTGPSIRFERAWSKGRVETPKTGRSRIVDMSEHVAGPKTQRNRTRAGKFGHQLGAKYKSGAPGVLEAPDKTGGPSRTRTLDPLIKRRPRSQNSRDEPQLPLFELD
jgi:hypothetical protein